MKKDADFTHPVSRKVASVALAMAMELCWCGKVKARVREYVKWSDLRLEIKALVARANEHRFLEQTQASGSQDPESLAKRLLEA
eukprot:10071442-Alexandrium_andersonii.AAC.1